VLEAALDVDTRAITPLLVTAALDDTCSVLADFIVETRLAAAAAVQEITIDADAPALADDLVRVGTTPSIICQRIGKFPVREIGVLFATTRRRNQREQDDPKVL
jgi:hypothetical protein